MTDKIRKRRKPGAKVYVNPPLIQQMPGQRARIDPTAVGELVCFILACRAEVDAVACRPWSHQEPLERARRKAMVLRARDFVSVYNAIAKRMMETVDLKAVERARAEWLSVVAPTPTKE